ARGRTLASVNPRRFPDDDSLARRLASWAGLTPPSAAPTAPSGTVTFLRCMCGRNWRRPRTGGHGDMLHRCPHTLPDAHPVTTRAAGLDRAIRRQLDTGKHAARCSPATLAPPTSPTPELAHMAVRLWPIDRPASHAESALGMPWRGTPVHVAWSTVGLGQAQCGLRPGLVCAVTGRIQVDRSSAQVRTIWAVVLRLGVPVLGSRMWL